MQKEVGFCTVNTSDFYALLGSLVNRALDSQLDGREFPATALSDNNLRQVVHTHAPVLPSSITWYRQKLGCKQAHHAMQ